MSFPRYPAYKPSGVEWLGDYPTHWQAKPLWTLFRRVKRQGHEGEELLSVYRDHGVVPKSSRDDNFNKPSDDLSAYQLVEVEDLAINKMKAWQGSVAISQHKGIVSPAYHVYTRIHQQNSSYLHHLMRSDRYITGYLSLSKGIRVNQWDLQPEYHSRMPILLPPLEEQISIGYFLDHETAKIDALIAEQQRLIELLQEKRQAVISHAVTKGLNPDAPMKDSGVEWLGEVPEHWEIMGLTKTIGPVVDYRGRTPTKCDSGTLLVTAKNIRNGGIDYAISEEYVDPVEAEQLLQRGKPAQGDVLFTMEAPLGQVALVDREDIALAQRVVKFRGIGDRMTNEFLMWWLIGSHSQYQLNSLSTGSTALGIKSSKLSAVICAVPPLQEQMAISNRIRDLHEQLASVHSSAMSQIDLLQERRSALISAAVTGQIDVRGLAEAKAGEQ